jgi:hypothetical protein
MMAPRLAPNNTGLAIEYAYRYADEYDLVWLVNSEQASVLGDQLGSLAQELSLPRLADQQAMLGAVRRGLRGRNRWELT